MNAGDIETRKVALAEPLVAARSRNSAWVAYGGWVLICVSVFAVLLAWAAAWPYTGEGDSTLHFATARDANVEPWVILHAWGRPIHKLFIILPARFGIFPARAVQALITIVLMWQTMRLAKELGFKKPWLAGLMLIWQPAVFCLASDTMTELPFALGMVFAVRLWRARRYAWSSLLVGFLPMVRPEGFFLGALWGMMLLLPPGWFGRRKSNEFDEAAAADAAKTASLKDSVPQDPPMLEYRSAAKRRISFRESLPSVFAGMTASENRFWMRILLGIPGLCGLLCWIVACRVLKGSWFYFLDVWSWPLNSYEAYGRGSILHHVYLWPDYCGPVLTVLFVLGVAPSLRRRGMGLPWTVWAMVFAVHSIMYWGHWFAALGLMRIMASTSPVTALICLEGWLWCERKMQEKHFTLRRMRLIGWTAAAIAWACVMARYVLEPEHYHCFPIRGVAQYAVSHDMVNKAPMLFSADKTFYAEVGLPGFSKRAIQTFDWERDKTIKLLTDLPAGSIGMWDNQSSEVWYRLSIDQLVDLGFEIVHEEKYRLPAVTRGIAGMFNGRSGELRYVLLRRRAGR